MKVLLMALLALLGLGILAGLVGWRLRPDAVPGTPDAFTARFGEPENEYVDEPTGSKPLQRSLVYERARVRAVYAFEPRDKSWYFVGFFQPNSEEPLETKQALEALAATKPSSLFPLRRR